MNGQWIAVFKTGTHTDSNGNRRDWSERDLDRIADRYNSSPRQAPVVIGHPKDNAPAWGWIDALKREGNILLARPRQLASQFTEMLEKGLFKKRSISLYPDGSLRHVGFLGAMPPAVKGLPDFSFSDSRMRTIELSESSLSGIRAEFYRLQKEDEFIQMIAKQISDEMSRDRTLTFDQAFQKVVRGNPDILKGLEEIEAEEMKRRVQSMGSSGLVEQLIKMKKDAGPGVSASQVFNELHREYPDLTWDYIREKNKK